MENSGNKKKYYCIARFSTTIDKTMSDIKAIMTRKFWMFFTTALVILLITILTSLWSEGSYGAIKNLPTFGIIAVVSVLVVGAHLLIADRLSLLDLNNLRIGVEKVVPRYLDPIKEMDNLLEGQATELIRGLNSVSNLRRISDFNKIVDELMAFSLTKPDIGDSTYTGSFFNSGFKVYFKERLSQSGEFDGFYYKTSENKEFHRYVPVFSMEMKNSEGERRRVAELVSACAYVDYLMLNK